MMALTALLALGSVLYLSGHEIAGVVVWGIGGLVAGMWLEACAAAGAEDDE